jgi:STAS-like domain of unknown function (DUF4325)
VFSLHEHGTAFATRLRGAELADQVLELVPSDGCVEVDFSGVLSVSYSFADEFAGELTGAPAAPQSPKLCFVGMAPDVERVVRRCFANRGLDLAMLSVEPR